MAGEHISQVFFGTMKVYIFEKRVQCDEGLRNDIIATINRIAETTDIAGLVVAVYITPGNAWRGHLVRQKMTTEVFACRRGKWAFVREFAAPADLPPEFALIRMELGIQGRHTVLRDRHGGEFRFKKFYFDGVAALFAHELHHFRRHHLGLHPREGERAADKWAQQRACEAGYSVELSQWKAKRRPAVKTVSLAAKENPRLLGRVKKVASHLASTDLRTLLGWVRERLGTHSIQEELRQKDAQWAPFRALRPGDSVKIVEGRRAYLGQMATVVRGLRRNANRLSITTADGRPWLWPIRWLSIPEPGPAAAGGLDENRQRET